MPICSLVNSLKGPFNPYTSRGRIREPFDFLRVHGREVFLGKRWFTVSEGICCLKGWVSPLGHTHFPTNPPAHWTENLIFALWSHPNWPVTSGQYVLLRNFPVSQVAGCKCTLLVGNSSIRSCWEWGTDEFFPAVSKVLKMASESFIHVLLLLLGLFLKISRWVPLRTRQIFLQIYNTLIKTLFFLPQKKFTQKQHYTMMAKSFWKEKPVCRKSVKLTQFSTKLCYSVCQRISCRSARWKSP